MTSIASEDATQRIVEKAKTFGASLAGIAGVEALEKSPSHEIFRTIGMNIGAVGSREMTRDFEISWPQDANSALVIAVSHPRDKPELDWWKERGTPGNDILIRINKEMSSWIEATFGAKTWPLPYQIEHGGIFLKDAAVLAGLGCIGENNMLVTAEFGPRVRLRTLLIEAEFPPAGPVAFDPCEECRKPCRMACPQQAFQEIVYSSADVGTTVLPGRSGCYDRARCNIQMERNIETAVRKKREAAELRAQEEDSNVKLATVKYCRRCEFSCPVGRTS